MRKFLKQLKVKPGTSYQKTVARQKSPRYVLPIYGKDVVLQFAALVKVQL